MKEFLKSNTITYNLMSFTGFKSLVLFSLLLESPKTYEEICEYFRNHEYIKEDISSDTLRVYVTSLRRSGCEVLRERSPQGGKYSIVSHPFEFRITEGQIKGLMKVYRIILNMADVFDLLRYEDFLLKIADSSRCSELLDAVKKISIFNRVDKELLRSIMDYSKKKYKMTILYDSPKNGLEEIQIVPSGVEVLRSKLYLNAISVAYNQETSYHMNRIKKILDVDIENTVTVNLKPITVGYELNTLTPNMKLSDNERIVEIKENSVIIETDTTNLFMMKRRILEYGPICTVLYPQDFREDIINTLKTMQEDYKDE